MKKIISINPAKNYKVIGEVTISTAEEVTAKVEKAHEAKRAWKELGIVKRIELLKPICDSFKNKEQEIAHLI